MNTEDERRDEAEAAVNAASGVRLEGDVITANGSILSGIIPMENYSHNSIHPFTPSRYHVYSYSTVKAKNKLGRTNQINDQLDLFSDQYSDVQNFYDNQENLEHDSELVQETETSSNQANKPYFQKQILISDSNSERTFNTLGNHLKAHQFHQHSTATEHSERSISSSLNSSKKRRTNKVFCKANSHLLSKQQRKNYKHMISEDDESDETSALSDRASVCSCTCYGNNQSSEFWKSKSKKSKSKQGNHLEMQKSKQTAILNRKLTTTSKRSSKNQSTNLGKSIRSSSNVKYKNSKSNYNRRLNQEEELNLNQFNQLQNTETILQPYYYQTILPETENTIYPLNLFSFNNSQNLDQQFLNTTNEALMMQSNQLNPVLNQFASENLRNQFICNSNASNLNNLTNLELNAMNSKNLSYFINENLNEIDKPIKKQIKLINKESLKKEKSKKCRTISKPSNRLTNKLRIENQGSSEYLLKQSNDAMIENEPKNQFPNSKSVNLEKQEMEQEKIIQSQRASI